MTPSCVTDRDYGILIADETIRKVDSARLEKEFEKLKKQLADIERLIKKRDKNE